MSEAAIRHDGNQLKESAATAKNAVSDLARETGRYASQRMSDAKESAGAMMETVKNKAGEYNQTFVGFIQENPYTALGIAAGVGLALGLLMRRR